jgi:hypothetical protein
VIRADIRIGIRAYASHGVVEDNLIDCTGSCWDGGIWIEGGNVEVRRNRIYFEAPEGSKGIGVWGHGCLVSENTIVNSCSGIGLEGAGNLILNNVVSGSVSEGGCGDGIRVADGGDFNHIEGNVLTDNARFGLHFVQTETTSADHNIYRRNTARNNGGTGCTNPASNADFCDEGTGNTSHGDNYMPSIM